MSVETAGGKSPDRNSGVIVDTETPKQLFNELYDRYGWTAALLVAAGWMGKSHAATLFNGIAGVFKSITQGIVSLYRDIMLDGYKRWQERRSEMHAIAKEKETLRFARLRADMRNAELAETMAKAYLRTTGSRRSGTLDDLPDEPNDRDPSMGTDTSATLPSSAEENGP